MEPPRYQLVHVLVHSYLERVVGEIVDQFDRDVIDLRKSAFLDLFIILEELIVRRKTEI